MGLTRNFVFSSILTVSNYIFPFIVYPYVARVLGVDNIGICNFVDSIINYAVLISLMGITILGTRNIAKHKHDPEMLNVVFTSLFLLTFFFTILATVGLIAVTYSVHQLEPYRKLLLIGLIKVWGNFLLIDWLYKGLEDFRYITVRTILVKLSYVAAVFIFIHAASDYVTYFLIYCLMVAVNSAFNCARACKLVKFKFDFVNMSSMLGSFIILGFYLFLNSMYTTFNTTFLGFKCGDTEVGYYTTATKIFKIILALYTAYSSVVLPRASALLAQGKEDEFKRLIMRSMEGLVLFSIPIVLFSVIFSPGIVYVLAGPEYGGAVLPMMIVMPLIFIIGYEQILVVQILTPYSSDSAILFNSFIGAVVGIIGNICLVGYLQSVGSAIVWLAAEIVVLFTAQFFVTKITGLRFPFALFFKNVLAYLPYALIAVAIALFLPFGCIVNMCIGALLLVPYFIFAQKTYLKNPVYYYTEDKLKELVNKKLLRRG